MPGAVGIPKAVLVIYSVLGANPAPVEATTYLYLQTLEQCEKVRTELLAQDRHQTFMNVPFTITDAECHKRY